MSTDTIRPDDETVRGWLENATHEEIEREVLRSRQHESDLERELAQAREALKPFAELADRLDGYAGRAPDRLVQLGITAQMCLDARAALTPTAREADAETKEDVLAPARDKCANCGGFRLSHAFPNATGVCRNFTDAALPKPTDGGET